MLTDGQKPLTYGMPYVPLSDRTNRKAGMTQTDPTAALPEPITVTGPTADFSDPTAWFAVAPRIVPAHDVRLAGHRLSGAHLTTSPWRDDPTPWVRGVRTDTGAAVVAPVGYVRFDGRRATVEDF